MESGRLKKWTTMWTNAVRAFKISRRMKDEAFIIPGRK